MRQRLPQLRRRVLVHQSRDGRGRIARQLVRADPVLLEDLRHLGFDQSEPRPRDDHRRRDIVELEQYLALRQVSDLAGATHVRDDGKSSRLRHRSQQRPGAQTLRSLVQHTS